MLFRSSDLLRDLTERLRVRLVITDPGPAPKAGSQSQGTGAQPKAPVKESIASAESGPLAVSLGDVKAGTATERRFGVRHAKPFRITAIQGTDNYLLAKTDSESKVAHELTVTLQPSAPGEVSRTLRLVTDLPGRREVEVTIKARAVP